MPFRRTCCRCGLYCFHNKVTVSYIHYCRKLYSAPSKAVKKRHFRLPSTCGSSDLDAPLLSLNCFRRASRELPAVKKVHAAAPTITVDDKLGMRMVLLVHLAIKAWKIVLCKSGVGNINSCVMLYLHFGIDDTQVAVLLKRSDSFSSMLPGNRFYEDVGPSTGENDIVHVIRFRDNAFYTAYRVLLGSWFLLPSVF